MKLAKRFTHFSALTIAPGLFAPLAYAHPGHIANDSVHSLLHIEHIIALVTASVIAYTVFALRKK